MRRIGNTRNMRLSSRLRRSRPGSVRSILDRMRNFRLWLLVIGLLSLVAEALAAAAIFWRGAGPVRRTGIR
jgi:hypothetical protein